MVESVKIDYYRKNNKKKPFRVVKKEFEDEAREVENRQYRNRINIVEKEVSKRIKWELDLENNSNENENNNGNDKNENKHESNVINTINKISEYFNFKSKDNKNKNKSKNDINNNGFKSISGFSVESSAVTHALFSNIPRTKYSL